jgi:hypothetical protein
MKAFIKHFFWPTLLSPLPPSLERNSTCNQPRTKRSIGFPLASGLALSTTFSIRPAAGLCRRPAKLEHEGLHRARGGGGLKPAGKSHGDANLLKD